MTKPGIPFGEYPYPDDKTASSFGIIVEAVKFTCFLTTDFGLNSAHERSGNHQKENTTTSLA